MFVRIATSRQVRGPAWAAKYPERAGDLWVVAQREKKRKRVRIGPPTTENFAKAGRKRDEWEAALSLGASELEPMLALPTAQRFTLTNSRRSPHAVAAATACGSGLCHESTAQDQGDIIFQHPLGKRLFPCCM